MKRSRRRSGSVIDNGWRLTPDDGCGVEETDSLLMSNMDRKASDGQRDINPSVK
jgi:hypothetical protein